MGLSTIHAKLENSVMATSGDDCTRNSSFSVYKSTSTWSEQMDERGNNMRFAGVSTPSGREL